MINDEKIEFNENEGGEVVAPEEVSEVTEQILADEESAELSSVEAVDESVTDETQNESDVTYAFRWNYSDQYAHDKGCEKKQERKNVKGAIGYAAIMVTVFALAFAILFASICFDDLASWFNPVEGYSVKEIVEIGMPSSVAIFANIGDGNGSAGSGFIITESGYVLTNYHVVENALAVVVVTSDNRDYNATLVNYNEELDVALLYVEGRHFTPVSIGNSDTVELGEEVVAIGCPYGEGFMFSPSNGIISGIDRMLSGSSPMLQTNAPLNPGNSGGPLFDSMGRVIGIVTSKLLNTENSDGKEINLEGMAFAIPINEAMAYANAWIKADLERAMLGVTAVSVTEGKSYFFDGDEGRIYIHVEREDGHYIQVAENDYEKLTDEMLNRTNNYLLDAEITGVFITSVTKGLGAYGVLLPKDTVVEVDGIKVTTVDEIKAIFKRFSAGDKITIKYYRDGEYHTAEMTLKTKGDMLKAEGYAN